MNIRQAALGMAAMAALSSAPLLQAFQEDNPDVMVIRVSENSTGYLGVGTAEITSDRARALNLNEERGVEITSLDDSGPAAKAGLKKGDVVLEFNGQRIEGTEQFVRMVHETPPGRNVTLTVSRNGSKVTIVATTGSRRARAMSGDWGTEWVQGLGPLAPMPPVPPMPAMPVIPGFTLRAGVMGIEAEELSSQLAQFFGVKDGVLVRSVVSGSPAEKAGVKAGDIITKIDGKEVTSAREITGAIRRMDGHTFNVTISRDHRESTLSVTLDEHRGLVSPAVPVAPVSHHQQKI